MDIMKRLIVEESDMIDAVYDYWNVTLRPKHEHLRSMTDFEFHEWVTLRVFDLHDAMYEKVSEFLDSDPLK